MPIAKRTLKLPKNNKLTLVEGRIATTCGTKFCIGGLLATQAGCSFEELESVIGGAEHNQFDYLASERPKIWAKIKKKFGIDKKDLETLEGINDDEFGDDRIDKIKRELCYLGLLTPKKAQKLKIKFVDVVD